MAYVKQTFVDGQLLSAAHLNYIEAALAELDARLALVEAGGGGSSSSGNTITFYYESGSDRHILTAEAGMTWEEFLASDYNPQVECSNCGGGSLFYNFEEMSGGDSGESAVVGLYDGECANCTYANSGSCTNNWVCYNSDDGELCYVGLNDDIVNGCTYYNPSTAP